MTTLRALDPRLKLFMLLALSTAGLVCKSHLTLLAVLGLAVLLLAAGRAGLPAGKTVLRLLGVVLFAFVMQCVFVRGGEAALTAGGRVLVRSEGLDLAIRSALRLMIIFASALIVLCGEARDYLLALTQMKIPYEIAFMVLAALRFIPALRQEAQDVLCAVQMRGTKIKKQGFGKKLSIYLSILMPVVAGALRRSEEMALAMEARAFRALPKRSSMRTLRFKAADAVCFVFFGCIFSAVLIFV